MEVARRRHLLVGGGAGYRPVRDRRSCRLLGNRRDSEAGDRRQRVAARAPFRTSGRKAREPTIGAPRFHASATNGLCLRAQCPSPTCSTSWCSRRISRRPARSTATCSGLRTGPRPPFKFKGLWIYAGDVACIHVGERASYDETSRTAANPADPVDHGSGSVDHIAFVGHRLRRARSQVSRSMA